MAAQAFNLIARLQLQGPQNIQQVVNRIQSRLNSIQANIALNIPTGSNSKLKSFNTTLGQTSTLLNQITTSAKAAAAALSAVASGMQATGTKVGRVNQATVAQARNMKAVATHTRIATTEMAEFGRISALAVRRFAAFSIPASLLIGLISNIKSGVRAAIDFEREMIRVQQVTGKTAAGIRGLNAEIGRLSTTFGAASGELAEVSRTLAQAGLSARQTKTALTAIAKTDLSPTFDSMKQTTEGVIAAMRQFNIAASQVESKLGAINAVAGSFAVESSDIISAIRRTGGAFKAAGGSIEELIALFTSVRSTTRESADSIATGFRTIFTRLQRPRTIQFLRDFNIELQKSGKFVGPYEAIKRLSSALKNLDPRDVRFSRITEELGGFRQVSKVIPLIQQAAVSQQALQVALAGTESVSKDAIIAQSALAVQISKVGQTWQELYRDITGNRLFQDLAAGALAFANSLASVVREIKPLIPLLLAVASVRGLSILGQFGKGFGGGVISSAKGAQKFARGGPVSGTDTVPAMLTPGEFVMTRSASRSIGYGNLNAMNKVRGYAAGGKVDDIGIRRRGAQTMGRGSSGNLIKVAVASGIAQAFAQGDEKMQGLILTMTKFAFAIEGARLAIGGLQGITGKYAQALRGGGGRKSAGLKSLGQAFNPFSSTALTGQGAARQYGAGSRPRFFDPRLGGGRRGLQGLGGRRATTLFGRSKLNVATKALTGFSFGILAAATAVAAVTAAFLIMGSKFDEQADKMAETARTQDEMNRAVKKARTASTLKGAGYGVAGGAAVGAAIGSIVPVLGTAIGALIGGLAGGIIGATIGSSGEMEARKKELRKINRESRFTEATEGLDTNLERLLSGDIGVRGSKQLGQSGKQIGEILEAISGARFDQDEREVISRTTGLKGRLPQLERLKAQMIDAGAGIEAFTKEGTTGAQLVKTFALVLGESTRDVRESIEADIKTRQEGIDQNAAFQASISELSNSLRVLGEFNAAVSDMTHRLNAATSQIGVLSDLSQGRTAIGAFQGRAGFGDFSRIGKGGITDRNQFLGGINQVVGGEFAQSKTGKTTQARLRSLAIMMDEIPDILSQVAGDPALSEETAGARFRSEAEKRFAGRGLVDIDKVVDKIQSGIRAMTTGNEGVGAFKSLGGEDPQALFGKVGGGDLNKRFEVLDKISAGIVENVKKFDNAIRVAVDMEISLYKRRLMLGQQAFNDAQALHTLRNPTGGPVGAGAFTAQKGKFVKQALAGTRAAGQDPFDVVALGAHTKAVNEEIKALNDARQGMTVLDKGFVAATNRLRQLSVESQKLHTALSALKDVTDEAAQIQKTLNLLEEQKKARFSLQEQFTFGTREDRKKILQSIADTVRVHAGGVDIDRIPGARRGGIMGMQNRFANTPALMFGLDPVTGQPRTGQQGSSNITAGRMSRISVPGRAQGLFGPNLSRQAAEARPDQLNAAEKAQVDMMQKLFDRRASAEQAFLDAQQSNFDSLGDTITREFTTFAARLIGELTRSERRGREREIGALTTTRDTQQTRLKLAREAQSTLIGAGADKTLTLSGAVGISKALATKENKKALRGFDSLQAMGQVMGQLGTVGGRGIGPRTTAIGEFGGELSTLKGFETPEKLRAQVEKALLASKGRDPQRAGILVDEIFDAMSASGATVDEETREATRDRFARAAKTGRAGLFELFGRELTGEVRTISTPMGAGAMQSKTNITRPTVLSGGLDAFMRQFTTDLSSRLGKQGKEGRAELGKALGIEDADVFTNILKSQERLAKISESFGDMSDGAINELPTQIANLNKELETLKDVLATIPGVLKEPVAVPPGQPQPLALGGPAFKRQGTDTVPAMLTPGEFVVNKAAAQKNMELLRNINGGVQYAAGGGLIDQLSPYEKEMFERRQAYRQGKLNRLKAFTEDRANLRAANARPSNAVRRRQRDAARALRIRERRGGLPIPQAGGVGAGGMGAIPFGGFGGAAGPGMFGGPAPQAGGVAPRPVRVAPGGVQTIEQRLDAAKARLQKLQNEGGTPRSIEVAEGVITRLQAKSASRLTNENRAEKIRRFHEEERKRRAQAAFISEGTIVRNISGPAFVKGETPGRLPTPNREPFSRSDNPGGLSFKEFIAKISRLKQDITFLKHRGVEGKQLTQKQSELADMGRTARQWLERGKTERELQIQRGFEKTESDVRRMRQFSEAQKRLAGTGITETQLREDFGPDFAARSRQSILKDFVVKGRTGGTDAYDDRFRPRRPPQRFHDGGMVPGSGDTPAILQGGEFVLSKGAVQGLAKGGAVKGYQNGGTVSSAGGESISALSQTMAEVSTALGETTAGLVSSAQLLANSVAGLSTAVTGFSDGVGQMAQMATTLAAGAESMRGAATEIRDALAQEIQINVTHTHEPITVTVEGGESTTQSGSAFDEMVMAVVGPEIDNVVSRVRELGPGLA